VRYDALLFDFDGVLADTERVHHACWNEILAPFGVAVAWPWYWANCVGVADHVLAPRFGVGDPPLLVAAKQQRFREALEQSPPFLESTVAFLRELAGSYRMAVVSSSFRTEVEPPLVRSGLDRCFQKILCGDDVTRLKPAPDPYLKAAEILSAQNPLVIEDSDSGIASARAAGFDFVRVTGPEEMVNEVRKHLASARKSTGGQHQAEG
jgi:beta-phosphoglucomutase